MPKSFSSLPSVFFPTSKSCFRRALFAISDIPASAWVREGSSLTWPPRDLTMPIAASAEILVERNLFTFQFIQSLHKLGLSGSLWAPRAIIPWSPWSTFSRCQFALKAKSYAVGAWSFLIASHLAPPAMNAAP